MNLRKQKLSRTLTSAWIETSIPVRQKPRYGVALSRVRGLKLRATLFLGTPERRTLTSAWIETVQYLKDKCTEGVALSRVRGLKHIMLPSDAL